MIILCYKGDKMDIGGIIVMILEWPNFMKHSANRDMKVERVNELFSHT